MAHVTGSWAVQYKDGTLLPQHDGGVTHKLNEIDWDVVDKLILESQHIRQTFQLQPLSDDLQWSLRFRRFNRYGGSTLSTILLVQSVKGQPVNDETVQQVMYWIPNGAVHHCTKFWCPDVAEYTSALLSGLQPSIVGAHRELQTQVTLLAE